MLILIGLFLATSNLELSKKQPKELQDKIKPKKDHNVENEEKKQILKKSLLQHANLWMTHYLEITGASSIIGFHMSLEVYEMLEKGNNKKQSQHYFGEAIVKCYELEAVEKAFKSLQEALKWNPKNFEALALKGGILMQRGLGLEDKKECFERSQKSLSKSLAINSNYRLAQIYQAQLYNYQNKKDQCKQLVESTLNQWKLSDKEGYHEIIAYANGFNILGKYKEALTMYNQVMIINPSVSFIYEKIAYCYFILEQYNKSLEYFNKYLETHGYKKKGLGFTLGSCYYLLKKYNLALEQYKIYIEVCPENDKEQANLFIRMTEEEIQQNENDNE